MIQIAPETFIISALLLVVLPLDWLVLVLISSLFHEMCHILSVKLLNGRLQKIKIRFMGCTIEASGLEEWKQFISILAGPIGSLSLLILYRFAPKLALCGFIQAVYNLLPFQQLDGGRLLQILLNSFNLKHADIILQVVAIITCVLLDILIAFLVLSHRAGLWLIFAIVIRHVRMLPRKIPCKPLKIGVQ